MTRILVAGDFHGLLDPLVGAIDRLQPDLLLSPGDWGDPGQVDRALMQQVLARVPVLTVYGNHDDRAQLSALRNADHGPVLLEQGEMREIAGLRVAGISGIWAKSRLGSRLNARWEAARLRHPDLALEEFLRGELPPPYVTDEEVAGYASSLVGKGTDILITHGCPVGLADATVSGARGGQRCFRLALNAVRPRLHLCGHLHRRQRGDLPDGAAVLNSGNGAEGQGWLIRWSDSSWDACAVSAGGAT